MKAKSNNGFIYYMHIEDNPEEKKLSFSSISELNTNSKTINTLKINSNKIISISSENNLLQWEQNKEKEKDIILTEKPIELFPKIKFKSISLSKSVVIGLDINGNVLVWGQSTEGVLGLGFDISKVENPTILEDLKNIIQISSSDHHVVAVNSEGNAYSWGTGKYGELGLERSIYSPVPKQILSDTYYIKVFCSNLISCFLDFEGHFHYFGVVIKQLSGNGSTLTIKSLLDEKMYNDGKILFLEKQIEELENEKFKNILIGNGFIVLLSFIGNIFILEYNDKLTKLYTKYDLENITISNDDIFGLAKEDKNNLNVHYLLRWKSHYNNENDLCSDSWHTTIWKFINDNNILSNFELISINSNKGNIFFKFIPSDENKEEIVHLSDNDNIEKSLNLEIEKNNNSNSLMNNIKLELENEFDDSYNLKYKRNQLNSLMQDISMKTFILNNPNNIYNSFYTLGKNSSMPFNYNVTANKTILLQNKLNSPLIINKSQNIFERNGNKINLNKGNFIFNSNGELLSKNISNKNDVNDNVNIYEMDDNRSNINNKSNNIKKNLNFGDDNYNNEENEFIKNELNKYRNDVENIINNFNQKKQSKSFSIFGKNKKRGYNNFTNINLLDKYKEDNTSYDNSNNDLIRALSINKSISNQIHNNNDNSFSINNENRKNNKRQGSLNKKEKEGKVGNEKNDLYNSNRKSRNKDRISPTGKIIFKDKRLKNLVEHLSLIEEESEPSMSILKRKRRFSFSKKSKKSNLKVKKNETKNLKKHFFNINNNNEKNNENKTESIIESHAEESDEKNKNNYSDFDLFNINVINKKYEDKNEINDNNSYNKDENYNEDEDNINNKKINEKKKRNDYEKNYNGMHDINRNKKHKMNSKNTNKENYIFNNDEQTEEIEQDNKDNQSINNKNNKKRNKNNYQNNNNYNNQANEEDNSNESDSKNQKGKKNNINNLTKNIKKNQNNNNLDISNAENEDNEVEEEEEYIDDKGNIIKGKKIKKKSRKYQINNYKNIKNNKYNNEEEGECSNSNNSKAKNEKFNMMIKNQSKDKDNDIYNNGLSPKKSIKFKNTFGQNMISSEDKNPFKNSQKEINYKNNEENQEEENEENIDDNLERKNRKYINNDKNKNGKIIYKDNNDDIKNSTEENNTNINEEIDNLDKNNLKKKSKKKNEVNKGNNKPKDNIKVIMMYFIYLIEYYMKKKVFALYARKIANYQKYLEKKFALKILYRLIKKRIIFYKIKFMHRYKKIYKYLYKNNIESIAQIYSEESSSYYFFSENNNSNNNNNANNNRIIPKKNKISEKNILNENKKNKNSKNINKSSNNKPNKEKIQNIKKIKSKK